MSDLDIFEAEAGKSASASSPNLSKLVEEMAAIDLRADALEAEHKAEKSKLHEYASSIVADAMRLANQATFTISDGQFAGVKATSDDFVSGSLPKDLVKRAAAIKYLEGCGGGGMVEDVITITIPKEKNNDVHRLLDLIKAEGYTATRESKVHPQTLCAWARERLRNGEPLDDSVLGLFLGRLVKLTYPRKKVGKKERLA